MSPAPRVRGARNPLPRLLLLMLLLSVAVVAVTEGGTLASMMLSSAPDRPPTATLAPIIDLRGGSLALPTLSVTPPAGRGGGNVAAAALQDRFVGTVSHSEASCDRSAIRGTIHDGQQTLDGIRVRAWWPGAPVDAGYSAPSGSVGGPGQYEVLLDDAPKAGWWAVAVVDEAGRLLSDSVAVETTGAGCEDGTGRQLVTIDFWRSQGTLGVAGPTLTPAPAIMIATATPAAPAEPLPLPPPLPAPGDGVERVLQLPILMYHYISSPPSGTDPIRHDLSVGPDIFRAHLVTLREQGYQSVTLGQLFDALAFGSPLPAKPVVLTFDDGYRDNYENAFPILLQEGFVGTFFIVTDLVEERNQAYLTWEQVVEMQQAGMEIGSHTRTHLSLPGESQSRIWRELTESRALMRERLGQEVRSFAYPYGHFDDGVAHLTHVAGYSVAVTTRQGISHSTGNLMSLRRIRVRGGMFPEDVMGWIEYWRRESGG